MTSVPRPPPSADMGNVFLCRPATHASVSRDSSSALCRPTASVRNSDREREGDGVRQGWRLGAQREEGGGTHTQISLNQRPQQLCLSSAQVILQHQTLHGTEASRNGASQSERDPFVYVDPFRDAWQQRAGRPKSCHSVAIPYLTVKALAGASAPPGSAQAHRRGMPVCRGAPKSELGEWTVFAGEVKLLYVVTFDIQSPHSPSPITDVNECDEDPCEGKGRCINNYGSYICQCHSGYSQVITQNRKFCQGETQPTW